MEKVSTVFLKLYQESHSSLNVIRGFCGTPTGGYGIYPKRRADQGPPLEIVNIQVQNYEFLGYFMTLKYLVLILYY